LHLRIDNADRRLTPYGGGIGLIGDIAWAEYLGKQQRAQRLADLLEKTRISSAMLDQIANAQRERLSNGSGSSEEIPAPETSLGSAVGGSLEQLLRRPEVVIDDFAEVLRERYPEYFAEIAALSGEAPSARLSSAARNEMKTVETEIKYAGY